MVNELQVIVQQEPGVISWNFEQLKETLAEMMSSYADMVYTPESISTARSDVAALRKLKTAVEDRRKEIKNKCLEPYNVIEKQVKQLTGLIDEPIKEISSQISAYEEAQKEKNRKAISEFATETFKDLPKEISAILFGKIYSQSWENISTPKKTWMNAIREANEQTVRDLGILETVDPDFRETAMNVYCRNLVLAEALQKVNELTQQREMIREQERKRKEEEEARRREEEEKQKQAQESPEVGQIPSAEEIPNISSPETVRREPEAIRGKQRHPAAAQRKETLAPEGIRQVDVRIWANESQLARIYGFIQYTGASYQEVFV